jgi:hypothetical protein
LTGATAKVYHETLDLTFDFAQRDNSSRKTIGADTQGLPGPVLAQGEHYGRSVNRESTGNSNFKD